MMVYRGGRWPVLVPPPGVYAVSVRVHPLPALLTS